MSKKSKSRSNNQSQKIQNESNTSIETTITITKAQLEKIITNSIKTALKEIKTEEAQSSDIQKTPATFTLLYVVSFIIFLILGFFSVAVIITCVYLMIQKSQYYGACITILLFAIFVLIISVSLCVEINKTKRIEVLNTIFSAIMALSTLLVAIVSAYFAYKSIGGGAA